jgi:hypothetical protein
MNLTDKQLTSEYEVPIPVASEAKITKEWERLVQESNAECAGTNGRMNVGKTIRVLEDDVYDMSDMSNEYVQETHEILKTAPRVPVGIALEDGKIIVQGQLVNPAPYLCKCWRCRLSRFFKRRCRKGSIYFG